ncbi:MAG: type IVB secretion system protein IcmH/DotU [Rhodobacteraceae bacterium]|nr:type IVB secretion system protein IcmH/DotU [Paracoccaceae bacterium]
MGQDDDPFGLSNDAGRTRIRPIRSGQAQGAGTAAVPPATSQGGTGYGGQGATLSGGAQSTAARGTGGYVPEYVPQGAPRLRRSRLHPNPLVSAFAGLLEIAPELERAAPPAQPQALRQRMFDSLIDARDAAVGMGIPLSRAEAAAWFVGALIDDIALNTPWGGHSDWPRQPLVTQLKGDVDAGTKFFDRLDELLRYPNRDPQLLEIAYICLGLGFRGKFRVRPGGGEAELLNLRMQAARALRDREAETAPLSPNWQGVTAPDGPRRFVVPIWTVFVGAVALVTGIYVALSMQLSNKAEQLYALAGLVPPPERAAIYRPVRETVAPPPEIKIEPVVIELLPTIEALLPPDTAGAFRGSEDTSFADIILQGTNPEVFRSAKADLNDVYLPLVQAIGAGIAGNVEVIGGVTVIGHTDNVPVQRSNPFGTNQGLSEARAATIAALLVAAGVPAELVKSEGRADSEPIADNSTKDGRAQNRRVEIKIQKKL